MGLFQRMGADLDRHPAGNFTHRREKREDAALELHRFVADGLHQVAHQRTSQRFVRGKVQVGEEELIRPQQFVLARDRFLDFDDHVGASVDRVRGRHEFRTRRAVLCVRETTPLASAAFDQDSVSPGGVFASARGGNSDAKLVILDLFGHAYQHDLAPLLDPAHRPGAASVWPESALSVRSAAV